MAKKFQDLVASKPSAWRTAVEARKRQLLADTASSQGREGSARKPVRAREVKRDQRREERPGGRGNP